MKRLGIFDKLSALRLGPLRRDETVVASDGGIEAGLPAAGAKLDLTDIGRDCMNCGAPLTGPFCQNCGQKHDDIRRPFFSFVQQVFDDVIATDSRSWRTILYLIFLPGKLSVDYNNGKRARFLPPLRLYLILTFVFFLTLLVTSTAILDIEIIPDPVAIERYKARGLEREIEKLTVQGTEDAEGALKQLMDSGLLRTDFGDDAVRNNDGLKALRAQKRSLESILAKDAPIMEEARLQIEARLAAIEGQLELVEEQRALEQEIADEMEADRLEIEQERREDAIDRILDNFDDQLDEELTDEQRRDIQEARKALAELEQNGMVQGVDGFLERLEKSSNKTAVIASEKALLEGPVVPPDSPLYKSEEAPGEPIPSAEEAPKPEIPRVQTFGPVTIDTGENNDDGFNLDNLCSDVPLSDSLPYRACVRMFAVVGDDRREGILQDHLDAIRNSDDAPSFAKNIVLGFLRVVQNPKGFNNLFNDMMPWAMALLIPVFALILRLFHWGERRYYMNQVIFSLHFHSFLFVLLALVVVIAPYASAVLMGEAFWIITSLYLVIALKFGQNQGWIKSFLKAGFIWIPYSFIMLAAVLGSLLYGLQEV